MKLVSILLLTTGGSAQAWQSNNSKEDAASKVFDSVSSAAAKGVLGRHLSETLKTSDLNVFAATSFSPEDWFFLHCADPTELPGWPNLSLESQSCQPSQRYAVLAPDGNIYAATADSYLDKSTTIVASDFAYESMISDAKKDTPNQEGIPVNSLVANAKDLGGISGSISTDNNLNYITSKDGITIVVPEGTSDTVTQALAATNLGDAGLLDLSRRHCSRQKKYALLSQGELYPITRGAWDAVQDTNSMVAPEEWQRIDHLKSDLRRGGVQSLSINDLKNSSPECQDKYEAKLKAEQKKREEQEQYEQLAHAKEYNYYENKNSKVKFIAAGRRYQKPIKQRTDVIESLLEWAKSTSGSTPCFIVDIGANKAYQITEEAYQDLKNKDESGLSEGLATAQTSNSLVIDLTKVESEINEQKALEAEKQSLEADLNETGERLVAPQQTISEKKAAKQNLRGRLSNQTTIIQSQEVNRQHTEAALRLEKQKITDLKETVTHLQEALALMKSESDQDVANVTQALDQKNSEIHTLEADIAHLLEEVTKLEEIIKVLESEVDGLEDGYDNRTEDLRKKSETLETLKSKNDNLKQKVDSLVAENSHLGLELTNSAQEFESTVVILGGSIGALVVCTLALAKRLLCRRDVQQRQGDIEMGGVNRNSGSAREEAVTIVEL